MNDTKDFNAAKRLVTRLGGWDRALAAMVELAGVDTIVVGETGVSPYRGDKTDEEALARLADDLYRAHGDYRNRNG